MQPTPKRVKGMAPMRQRVVIAQAESSPLNQSPRPLASPEAVETKREEDPKVSRAITMWTALKLGILLLLVPELYTSRIKKMV